MIQKISKLITAPTHELGRWTRFLVFQVRVWFHCLRLLKINRCGTQAAALAYHSIFGLVPLAIVTLMVFQMFPANRDMSDKARDLIYSHMNLEGIKYPVTSNTDQDEQVQYISVADKLDEMSEKFISSAHTGAITVVGIVLVVYAALRLLTTIERTFNTIFHVNVGRSILHRLINYWALLTLGPILLALGIYVSTQIMKHEFSQKLMSGTVAEETIDQSEIEPTKMEVDPNATLVQSVKNEMLEASRMGFVILTAKIVPFLISVIAFFFLYFVLPNTRVSPRAALWGAFVGALLWALAKYGFGFYLGGIPGFKVYGILGIIPVTVYWIFISWLIVLFGLQLTYAAQNIKRLDAVELARTRQKDICFLANDQTVVRVMEYVLNAFEQKDQKPISIEAVAHRLSMPLDFTEKILEQMVKAELLCRTNEPVVGYVPSTDGENIKLSEISKAVSEVSFAQADQTGPPQMREVFEQMRGHLSKYTLKEVLNRAEDFELQSEIMQNPEDEPPSEETV